MSDSLTTTTVTEPSRASEPNKGSRPVLEVNIVSRVFDAADGSQLQAVEQLSFSLQPASFTCIVGPSGCGKTTTLRAILGLDTQFDGTISRHYSGPVTAVFQEPRLLPWRTVEQNVRLALPAERSSMPLDALFDALGLTRVRHFFPSELSLGLARRAALARAFAVAPDLLVLDEPFVSLDDDTAGRLRKVLMQLWSTNPTTALMVTHNVREAVELADHILVFSERPARVLGCIRIDMPRAQRDTAYVERMALEVRQCGQHT